MGRRRPAGWNLGQGCLEASAVPTQHAETRARGTSFLRQPQGWGPGEGQRPPGILGTLGYPGAKTFHSVPRPMHEPQTHAGSPRIWRASSKGTGWGPQGMGRRQAGVRRAGADASTAQHTAGQTAYHRAGPAAPRQAAGARCPLLASAFRVFLFQRQRLHDLEGSLGPGAGSTRPCCPWPSLALFAYAHHSALHVFFPLPPHNQLEVGINTPIVQMRAKWLTRGSGDPSPSLPFGR